MLPARDWMRMAMASTIQESRILDALARARNVGLVEEQVNVCGCTVVLRNLRPDEYEAILAESSEKKDAGFIGAFQMGHVCRAICEINGVDLRDLEYIETTQPDPKTGKDRKVTLERHEWLRSNVLNSWSREALSVLYRKFVDVLDKAERTSVDGVVFTVPDESNEDKFHRLLGELKALEEELPDDLVVHVLETHGYMHKREDAKVGAAKLDAVAKETGYEPKVEEQVSVEEPQREADPPPVADVPAIPVQGVNPMDLIRRKPGQQPRTRADQIAELEAAVTNLVPEQVHRPSTLDADVVLEKPTPKLDPEGAASILDRPPVAGINPRYRPHNR